MGTSDERVTIDLPARLLESARTLMHETNYASASVILDQVDAAIALQEGHDSTDVREAILWERAQLYRDTGRPDAAVGCYDRLTLLTSERGDRDALTKAKLGKVIASMNSGRVTEALAYLKEASIEALKTKNPEYLPELGFWWARIFEEAGRIEVARGIIRRRVLRQSDDLEPADLRSARHAFHMRLCLESDSRDFSTAERSLETSISLVSESSPLLRQAQAAMAEALFLVVTGDRTNGERKLALARSILHIAGISSRQADEIERILIGTA